MERFQIVRLAFLILGRIDSPLTHVGRTPANSGRIQEQQRMQCSSVSSCVVRAHGSQTS